ncbi:MAG: elongation factor P [Candidatus Omnitrophica bacterium]|nr:elongation factor P [Candidatus Omnitrophota bacterium]
MTISINQITSGMGLNINGDIYVILEYHHVKPGKGSAFARIKLRNAKTQQVLERTFKSSDKLEDVPLEERRLQYMYNTDDEYHFMDNNSFEERIVPKQVIGDGLKFLQDNAEVTGLCYHNEVLNINLPTFITAEVTHTDLGLKGDSSRSGNKPATIDTGATIQVPLFINTGEKIRVDTRTGEYVERVKE